MEPPPPPAPKPLVRKPVVLVGSPDSPEGDGSPVPVELQYVGVGDLHQRWFGDTDIVASLATSLGECMKERAVVRMTWDEPSKTGHIWLLIDGKQLTCHPATPLDVAPMVPLFTSLAHYRDAVSGRFDMRVASFRVGLEVLQGTNLCRMQLGGQYPPDGSTLSGCVDMGGEVRCLPGDKKAGHTAFSYPDPAHTAYLSGCLKP